MTSCLEYMIHKVNAHFTMLKARPNPEAFSVNIWSTNFLKQRISCKLVQCLRLSVNIENMGWWHLTLSDFSSNNLYVSKVIMCTREMFSEKGIFIWNKCLSVMRTIRSQFHVGLHGSQLCYSYEVSKVIEINQISSGLILNRNLSILKPQ